MSPYCTFVNLFKKCLRNNNYFVHYRVSNDTCIVKPLVILKFIYLLFSLFNFLLNNDRLSVICFVLCMLGSIWHAGRICPPCWDSDSGGWILHWHHGLLQSCGFALGLGRFPASWNHWCSQVSSVHTLQLCGCSVNFVNENYAEKRQRLHY